MADLTDILRLEDKVLEFARDIEVLGSLETVVNTFREKRGEIAGLGVSDILDFITSIEEDQDFFNALGGLGLDAAKLKGLVAAVSGALGKIPEEQRKLLQALSDFDEQTAGKNPGLVDWTILDAGKNGQAAAADYSFNIGAESTLAFEAGDTWPRPDTDVPDPLLRLGIAGALTASGNATRPFNAGSVKVDTTNTASAALDYFFSPEQVDELYVAAVGKRLGDLCNPFSLDSLWRHLASTDLRGVIAHIDGSTSLNIDVSIAEGFSIAGELAQATVGLTVGAHIKRAGAYDLIVRALPSTGISNQSIEVSLLRNSLLERGRSLSMGINVDLTGLAMRLREILKRHHGAFKDVLEEYEKYLTPGTYLRDELNTLLDNRVDAIVGDSNVQNILKGAFQGALGLDKKPGLPALKGLIKEQITDRFDELGEVITGRADEVAREAASKVASRIGLNAGEALDAINAEVESLVEDLQGDLKDKISSKSESALGKLSDKLKRAGADVSGAVGTADDALKGVREIIGKYEGLLKKLIKETENAARTKITAKLTHEETRTSGKVIDVSMTVSSNTIATQDAFDTLVRGDLDGIVKLLGTAISGIDFDRDNMALTRFATLNEKLGFEIVFLGFEFGSQSIFDANAHVTSDGAGRVSVTSNATLTKRKSSPREERELQFVDAFELAAAKATRQLNIDLSISHQDEALRRDEVVAFLRSFEMAKLMPEGTTDRAVEVFVEWAGPGDDQEIAADIDLGLRLDQKASLRLLKLSERANGSLTDTSRRNLFRVALRELCESGAYDLDDVIEFATGVLEQTRMGDSKPLVDVLYDYTVQLHRRTIGDRNLSPTFHKRRIRELERANRFHKLCMAFVEFTDTMGDIYEATPSLSGDDGWTENDYLHAQKKLNRQIKKWLRIKSKFVFWIGDEAHPRTVAFTGALVALAGIGTGDDSVPALSLSLVRRDGVEADVTLT